MTVDGLTWFLINIDKRRRMKSETREEEASGSWQNLSPWSRDFKTWTQPLSRQRPCEFKMRQSRTFDPFGDPVDEELGVGQDLELLDGVGLGCFDGANRCLFEDPMLL